MYLSWVLGGRIPYALAQSKAVEITMMILVTLCLSGEYRKRVDSLSSELLCCVPVPPKFPHNTTSHHARSDMMQG